MPITELQIGVGRIDSFHALIKCDVYSFNTKTSMIIQDRIVMNLVGY